MDKNTREAVIGNCLQTIHARLNDAASISSAAKACAETGHLQKSIEILFDIEPMLHEAKTMLSAAVLFNRLSDS